MGYGLPLAISGVFVVTALLAGAATWWWLARNTLERRRLLALTGPSLVVPLAAVGLTQDTTDPFLAKLSRLVPKSPKEMSRIQRRLLKAGYPSPDAAVYYSMAQLGMPLLFAGVAVLILGVAAWPYVLVAAGAGYTLPLFFIGRQTAKRQKAIQNGLADALDLLTICMEAGSGLDQAIAKASEELGMAHPEVAGELRLVTTETRVGKPRLEAFRNFAQRTGVEDVQSLVSMLTQTDRFGTSVGQALRSHADTIRTKRRQRAEERSGKVSVKLVFPLALCLFPALYVVCFGSVVIQISKAFF